jgi:uncharacterized membrane protein
MKQQNKDLFLILIIAIINTLWACFPNHVAVIGTAIALPLVFLTPGYLLLELLTQKREHDGITRLLLSIGLSLSIDILGGFLLNITPIGITSITWGIFLNIFIIVCIFLCMVKRRRWQLQGDLRQQRQRDQPMHYQLWLLLLTICIVIFSFAYTTNSIANQSHQGFTQFWLLLDNQQSHICAMQIGIYSGEAVTTTYQIEVRENHQHAASWPSITLVPQQKWLGRFLIPTNRTQAKPLQVEANLYRQQELGYVYRNAQMRVLLSKTTCIQK